MNRNNPIIPQSLKIVFISYHYWPPKFGGELLISIERFEEMVRRGHIVTVLTAGEPGLPRNEVRAGIKIFRSPIVHPSRIGRGIRRLLFPLWANWRMRNLQTDVVHLAGTGGIGPVTTNLGAAWVNRTAHRKGARTIWVHSLADTEKEAFSIQGLDRRLRNLWLRHVDVIVSVSPALNNAVAQFFPQKAVNINYGVHDDLFKPLPVADRSRLRYEYGVDEQGVVFVFLGSVSRRKGFDVLAHAFAALSPKYPNWYLWVIGPRTVQENQNIDPGEVTHVCAPLAKIQNRVHYFGRVDDRHQLADLLGLSDVFVFPSLKEGFGIAPVEAMAAGVPVIISILPGVTDVACIEGKTGLFVIPGDVNSLKLAMQTLGETPSLRHQMGAAATQRVRDGFSWQSHVDLWEELYSRTAEPGIKQIHFEQK